MGGKKTREKREQLLTIFLPDKREKGPRKKRRIAQNLGIWIPGGGESRKRNAQYPSDGECDKNGEE